MTLTVDDFDFNLPPDRIAQTPLKERSTSKLMILEKQHQTIQDTTFEAIVDQLSPGDALVLNNTKVLPARLYGTKKETGAHIEVLLLNNVEGDVWEVLMKPAKKAKVGTVIQFGDGLLEATVLEEQQQGGRLIAFSYTGVFLELLEQLGEMPLPPYITEVLDDADRYQTVYAKVQGSSAAPTAGLHFTDQLLQKVREKGIHIVYITLHVGLGTFRPVSVDNIDDHTMHSEFYHISSQAAETLNQVKKSGKQIIAVGTTTIRTLETIGQAHNGMLTASSGWTDIFITPGYTFSVVDGFITNFHLPKSTLIMLVSAFAGRDFILKAYNHAIAQQYRFFSFGDAMFVS